MNDETMQRAHIGPAKDPVQRKQSDLTRTPIVRTVSLITERKVPGPKGKGK